MSKLSKSIPCIAVAIAVYAFYAFAYGATLQYGEQYQLFQSTTGYFLKLFTRPGGLAMYAGRFLTQFFIAPQIGAIFISILATGIFACIAALSKSSRYGYQMAFLVALLSACILLDRQMLLNGLVCISIGCVILLSINSIKSDKLVTALLPIIVFATYWIAGGIPAAFVVGYVLCDFFMTKKDKSLLVSSLLSVLVVVASPFVARQLFGVQLNATRAFLGADYSRYVIFLPTLPIAIGGLLAFLPIINKILYSSFLQKFDKPSRHFSISSVTVWILAFSVVSAVFGSNVDFNTNRNCAIEYNVRTQNWKKAVELTDNKHQTDAITTSYLNLALAKTNRLGDKMFSFKQIGALGLIPDFETDSDVSMALSEIYYHLGFINFAERFAFEAAKANPDYQESVRAVKRLAETNIIKKNYPLARKYLAMLENTAFYAKWAQKCRRAIDSNRTDENPEWARLRSFQNDNDYFYAEKEKDAMLIDNFSTNQNNRQAFEYLMAFYLLNKDIEHFMQYADYGGRFYGIAYPRAFREAAIFHLRMTNPEAVKDFGTADRLMLDQFYEFGKIYNTNHHDSRLAARFGDTYWFYLFNE